MDTLPLNYAAELTTLDYGVTLWGYFDPSQRVLRSMLCLLAGGMASVSRS
jgi:hypothetical protein